jgi:hypothetical protein
MTLRTRATRTDRGRRCRRPLITTTLSAALALLAPAAAHADLTVTCEVTTTGQMPAPPPAPPAGPPPGDDATTAAPPEPPADAIGPQGPVTRTVSVRYRGKKARVEYGKGGPVLIFDGEAGKVYTLDPAAKTYATASLKDVREKGVAGGGPVAPGGMPPGMADRMRTKVSADLKADKDAESLSVADRAATRYALTGSLKMEMDMPSGFPGGGRLPPGGGFPGGAGGGFPGGGFPGGGFPRGGGGGGFPSGGPGGGGPGGPGGGGRMPEPPSTDLTGSLLLTREVALPDNGRLGALPSVMVTLGEAAGPFYKGVLSKLEKQKAFPLGGEVTLETKTPFSQAPSQLTVRTAVKSVSADDLPDDLFAVPADYVKASSVYQAGRRQQASVSP